MSHVNYNLKSARLSPRHGGYAWAILLLTGLALSPATTHAAPDNPDAAPSQIVLEGEQCQGPGSIMPRGNASQRETAYLFTGYQRVCPFEVEVAGKYQVLARYSNDGYTDVVEISLDNATVGQFPTRDTRPMGDVPGSGWNNFLTSGVLGTVSLTPGKHQLSFKVLSSDQYGVEIDTVELVREK